MAIFSFNTKPISRSAGRSAVAAAAYRSGTELVDQRTGLVHDYTRKAGVVHTEIVAPKGISSVDREQLWNAAETAEKRKDARIAREHLVALPHELDADQRLALARELANELVERYGVAVDFAIHAPDAAGDQRNHHAHLLATTRTYGHDGLGDKSAIELSDKKRQSLGMGRGADEVKMLRQRWETLANAALERAQAAERIDCRSLADQGIERVPEIHVGPMGIEMQRRGTPENSDRATTNLSIKEANSAAAELRQLAFENAERQIEKRHQLQIRADLRALYAAQQRLDAEAEVAVEAEFQEWLTNPLVCPATGRLYPENALDAQIAREAAMPENQPVKQTKPKPEPPEPAPAPAPVPEPAVFDSTEYAQRIVLLETPAEREGALLAAARELELDDYDDVLDALEPLMHAGGELTDEGRQMHGDVVTPARASSTRAQRVPSEQIKGFGFPGGPGF